MSSPNDLCLEESSHQERFVGDDRVTKNKIDQPLQPETAHVKCVEEEKEEEDFKRNKKANAKKKSLFYMHFLKSFYSALMCRSKRSDALSASIVAHAGQDPKRSDKRRRKKVKSAQLLLLHSSSLSSLTSSSNSLHSVRGVSVQLLRPLTTCQKLMPIEFIADDFEHDDYIDLSFGSAKKAFYAGESRRSSSASASGLFDFSSCFFNRDDALNLKNHGNQQEKKVAKTACEANAETDEFDSEGTRPKLYGLEIK